MRCASPKRAKQSKGKGIADDDESGDDEIIETLVKVASPKRRTAPRERRSRISDRHNLNRTLDGSQSWPGQEGGPNVGFETALTRPPDQFSQTCLCQRTVSRRPEPSQQFSFS
ncbi:hypothetical protein EVAR_64998_1 [Eumeta japonica]|uniref:Uncharacterized protein n=1 Tax=Eumeta variegata TaxID=151549 RepID=A0A4C1ZW95_EUMVA|nr:hypothetical protein EVAR_64998_1 [Eumeta japonica]